MTCVLIGICVAVFIVQALVSLGVWTVEQKRELVRAVTSAVAKAIKCPEGAVSVVIHDLPKMNWATGGKLAADEFPRK